MAQKATLRRLRIAFLCTSSAPLHRPTEHQLLHPVLCTILSAGCTAVYALLLVRQWDTYNIMQRAFPAVGPHKGTDCNRINHDCYDIGPCHWRFRSCTNASYSTTSSID